MDNILYIGPYREFSGEGNASRNYIKAMVETGHNISIRPSYNIFKSYPKDDIDPDVMDLENNSSKKYHTIIQHVCPHQLIYNSKFDQHIGIVHLDSFNYYSNISQYLNLMDTIVVGSKWLRNHVQNIPKFVSKVVQIPEPIDINRIDEYKKSNPTTDNNFKFYVISDYLTKKNIDKILLAFLLVSRKFTDIDLVLKLKNRSDEHAILESTIEYDFSKIYKCMKINDIKKPKILFGNTKYIPILYLHNNNNCLINISSGESFGYSCLEAMAFGNNIITNSDTGSTELAENNCGLVVDSRIVPCIDPDRQYSIYNTVDQKWSEPILQDLATKMIMAITESKSQKEIRLAAQSEKISQYTVSSVTQKFLEIL